MQIDHKIKLKNTYSGIKKRCNNKKHTFYYRYGGRGIKNLWRSYDDFERDMLESFLKAYEQIGSSVTLDRINNDGNYCKENCRWISRGEQTRNRHNNIKYKGQCISQISISLGGNRNLICERLKAGWDIKKACTTVANPRKKYVLNGKNVSLMEVSRAVNINYGTLERRMRDMGWSFEKAISVRPNRKKL